MSGAAALLARVKQRKLELASQQQEKANSWEWWDRTPSNTIYHPSRTVVSDSTASALYLTTEEKSRQRKISRLQSQEKQREKIKLGIERPPEPKLRLKNVGAVFGDAYVRDPTHYEILAQQAQEERHKTHEEINEARHLAAQQNKYQKNIEKIEEHKRAGGIHCVAMFFPNKVENKSQFILNYTAKKFLCSGVALLGDNNAYVVVESGEPEIAKFEKLGIKLGASISWKGPLKTVNFKRWSIHTLPDREKFLKLHGVSTMFGN